VATTAHLLGALLCWPGVCMCRVSCLPLSSTGGGCHRVRLLVGVIVVSVLVSAGRSFAPTPRLLLSSGTPLLLAAQPSGASWAGHPHPMLL
jgi:hypothetical protein